MLRSPPAKRLLYTLRHQISPTSFRPLHTPINRRLASSAAGPNRSSSWRSFLVRLGLAGGVVYYYNTAEVFQPQPALVSSGPDTPVAPAPTLESMAAERQQKRQASTASPSTTANPQLTPLGDSTGSPPPLGSETPIADPESLEAEAGQQGAFNPETGEINWDCPCLGGMAHGPCGEEFKAAFSCFVYSEADPKGMDCIDNFRGMQDCFRAHPDVYAAELEDDDEEEAATLLSGSRSETAESTAAEAGANVPIAAKVQSDAASVATRTKEATRQAVDNVKEKTTSAVDATKRAVEQAGGAAAEQTARLKE